MPGCCAFGCTNRIPKYKLFTIPSGKNDQERRKIWISRINRKGQLPIRARLCEVHFEPSQFERNIPGKLKPNAVPSIFVHRTYTKSRKLPRKRLSDSNADFDQTLHAVTTDHMYVTKRAPPDLPTLHSSTLTSDDLMTPEVTNSQPTDTVLQSNLPSASALQSNLPSASALQSNLPSASALQSNLPSASVLQSNLPSASVLQLNLPAASALQSNLPSASVLQSNLPSVLEDKEVLKRKNRSLTRRLREQEKEKNELESRYSMLFNADQINFLKHPSKKTMWSEETVKKALELRMACGNTGYNMLISQGFPLPSQRTLRRKLHQISCNTEIISEVSSMLSFV